MQTSAVSLPPSKQICLSGLTSVPAQVEHTRERVPGTSGEIVIAGCADLIDALLQAVEGGSFEGHIEPF